MVTRICYIIPTLCAGGAQRQLLELVRELVRDHEVTIICTRRAGVLGGDARRLGAYVRELHLRSSGDFRARSRLRRTFRSHRPDVLHTFLSGLDYPATCAARETGVPVVVSSRRQLATWKRGRFIRQQRRANQRVDCIVANSQAVAQFALEQEQADSALFRVIPEGIAVDSMKSHSDPDQARARYGLPRGKPVVGMVANFTPSKDYALFVEIANTLVKRRDDVHFLAVGVGPLVRPVWRQIRQAGLEAHFTRSSTLSELADIYSAMDVSLLCSRSAGSPRAVLEAMAARRPVVAARVGGIPEILQDGETGRLIEGRDPASFAQAIEDLLTDEDEARRLAEAAHAYVREHLNAGRMADAYRQLYAELLIRAARTGG